MSWWRRAWMRWFLSFAAVSLIFMLWPSLDLIVADWFYWPEAEPRFPARQLFGVQFVYVWAPLLGQVFFALALALLLLRWWRSAMIARWVARRALAWLLVVILGVGVVVHEGLKNRVGRPRPVQVEQMGGAFPFVPVFTVSPYCDRNCSFVSGHAAIGFSLIAWGIWSPAKRRRRWWVVGMATGAGVGAVRMAQGGHFLSDILFSGLAIWASALVVHDVWLRWYWYQHIRRRP